MHCTVCDVCAHPLIVALCKLVYNSNSANINTYSNNLIDTYSSIE